MRKRYLGLLLLIVLSLIGCGEEERNATADTLVTGEAEKEEAENPALKKMELLQPEDPENENLADMLQKNGAGMMVQLEGGNLLGSGVVYEVAEDRLLILTAAHVLEEAETSVKIRFVDGWSCETESFESFEEIDLAVVRLAVSDIPPEHRSKILCANVDKEQFDSMAGGDGCIAMGCRSGVAAEAYEGVVLSNWIFMEDYGQHMIWARAEGKPGMSGGGLFDSYGHFLGIISGGSEDGELAVIPLSLIQGTLP